MCNKTPFFIIPTILASCGIFAMVNNSDMQSNRVSIDVQINSLIKYPRIRFFDDPVYDNGAEKVSFFIAYANAERTSSVTTELRKELLHMLDEMLAVFVPTICAGKNFDSHVSVLLKEIENQLSELRSKDIVTLQTFFILGHKLAVLTDYSQLTDPTHVNCMENQDDARALSGMRHCIHSILETPLDRISLSQNSIYHYAIPFFSEDGHFGIGTWLFALANGYLIMPFGSKPTPAHSGSLSNYRYRFTQMVNIYEGEESYVDEVSTRIPHELNRENFISSVLFLRHDQSHLANSRGLFENVFGQGNSVHILKRYQDQYENIFENAAKGVDAHLAKFDCLILFYLLHEQSLALFARDIYQESPFLFFENFKGMVRQGNDLFIPLSMAINEGDFVEEIARLGLIEGYRTKFPFKIVQRYSKNKNELLASGSFTLDQVVYDKIVERIKSTDLLDIISNILRSPNEPVLKL